jgi:hypothetical protein
MSLKNEVRNWDSTKSVPKCEWVNGFARSFVRRGKRRLPVERRRKGTSTLPHFDNRKVF